MIRWLALGLALLLWATGPAAAQGTAAREGASGYPGNCPDNGHAALQDCRFDAALSLWRAPGAPSERVHRALVQCGHYSGIAVRFCTAKLEEIVSQDLEMQVAELRTRLMAADDEDRRACDQSDQPCAIVGGHVEMLDGFHATWLAYVDARCAYGTRYNRGGTGYDAIVARCWLLSAAAHMEQLEKPYEN